MLCRPLLARRPGCHLVARPPFRAAEGPGARASALLAAGERGPFVRGLGVLRARLGDERGVC